MNEIGGIFTLPTIKTTSSIEHSLDKYTLLDSGRSCFQLIVDDLIERGITNIYLPEYLCWDSFEFIKNKKVNLAFYTLSEKLEPQLNLQDVTSKNSALVLINYFGLVDHDQICEKIKNETELTLVLDLSHDAFRFLEGAYSKDIDYVFCSLRKCFPIISGGAMTLKLENSLDRPSLENTSWQASYYKAVCLKSEFESKSQASGNNLKPFLQALDDYKFLIKERHYNQQIDDMSYQIMMQLDISKLSQKRRFNFSTLVNFLKGMENIECKFSSIPDKATPLFLPVFIPKIFRDQLRSALKDKNIIAPVHWPYIENQSISNENTKNIYDTELSLIIDHRYESRDMEFIANEIKNFMELHS